MSNELVYEYTGAGVAVQELQRQLLALDNNFHLEDEPAAPELLGAAVEALASTEYADRHRKADELAKVTGLIDAAIARLLVGAGAKALNTGVFDANTATRIYILRDALLSLPLSEDPRDMSPEYFAKTMELRAIFRGEAERLANPLREVRAANARATAKFTAEREELLRQLSTWRSHLELASSRMARRVLLQRGVAIFDVMQANAKAQAWETFTRALVVECSWIACVGHRSEEKATALEVVRNFDTNDVISGGAVTNVDITVAYTQCIQALGYAS